MSSNITTIAFLGVKPIKVSVEVQIVPGMHVFNIVGLADKSVAESRERIRSAFHAIGLGLPYDRITVNLAPADMQKEGAHYDLAIAICLLQSMFVIPSDASLGYLAMGELSLDGRLNKVHGTLAAAIFAASQQLGLICSAASGKEAAWSGMHNIIAPDNIQSLINHFKGIQRIPDVQAGEIKPHYYDNDLSDVKGHETAKRALEIAASGGHNITLRGPPGTGKTMLAERLVSILPDLTPAQALEVTMIHSIAGMLEDNTLITRPPYRAPHHSASQAALIGGGQKAMPGEVSLAHKGVLFLDELPEYSRFALEALRQPIESGIVTVSRASARLTYPARFQLVTAMNTCKCGYATDPSRACRKVPLCIESYLQKISGPLWDRIDIAIDVPDISPMDIQSIKKGESSNVVAQRVKNAQHIQHERYGAHILNAEVLISVIETTIDDGAQKAMYSAYEKFKLSTRGYNKVLKVARTIADIEMSTNISVSHILEALTYKGLYQFSR